MDFVKLGKGGVFQSDIYYRFINSLVSFGSFLSNFLWKTTFYVHYI